MLKKGKTSKMKHQYQQLIPKKEMSSKDREAAFKRHFFIRCNPIIKLGLPGPTQALV